MKNEGPPNLTPFSWGCAVCVCLLCAEWCERKKCVHGTYCTGENSVYVCVCQGTEKTKWAGNRSRVCVVLCYSVKSLGDHLQLQSDAGETGARAFLVMY